MAAVPRTRYVKSGGVHIAYQVIGDGPPLALLRRNVSADPDIATHAIHAVALVVVDLDFKRRDRYAFVPLAERQRKRGARRERRIEQPVRIGPEVFASEVACGICDHDVRSDLDLLRGRADRRLGRAHRAQFGCHLRLGIR